MDCRNDKALCGGVATSVRATSNEVRSAPTPRDKSFSANKSIEGAFTNWSVGSNHINVTLDCTDKWELAKMVFDEG